MWCHTVTSHPYHRRSVVFFTGPCQKVVRVPEAPTDRNSDSIPFSTRQTRMLIPFWRSIPALGFLMLEVEQRKHLPARRGLQCSSLSASSPPLSYYILLSQMSIWGTGKLRVLKAHTVCVQICGRTSAQMVSASDHQHHLKAVRDPASQKNQEHKSLSLLSLQKSQINCSSFVPAGNIRTWIRKY